MIDLEDPEVAEATVQDLELEDCEVLELTEATGNDS